MVVRGRKTKVGRKLLRFPPTRLFVPRGLCCRALPVRGGYGYAVLYEGDTLIKQPYIPAVSGRVVFRTEQEALKVGQLVCDKLRAGLPPTVTRREVENCLKETEP